jgi:signal transduction histidine kinase
MLRLTLAARIALIVVIGMTVVWIATIALYYRASTAERAGVRPSPAQLAALAELVERTPPGERHLIWNAVKSDRFEAHIEAATPAPTSAPVGPAKDAGLREAYTPALAGRALVVTSPPDDAHRRWFPRLARLSANALEFRIALRTGETLVVDTRALILVTPLGLPVGFGAGLFGTIVALLALLIMQRETRPLARLAAAVDRVDLSADPSPLPQPRTSAPEIRAVVAAFNRLQGRLSEMLRARMTLVGGIAHDVRTFATRLRLRVDRIADETERRRAVADIDDMIRLLDDAMLSSRASAGELAQEMIELGALVRVEVNDRRTGGTPVDLAGDQARKDAIVIGDRVALRRILGNLIDNAIKYGRVAHVRTALDDGMAVVIVDDEGQGIPAPERQAMFEPFNRLETSRNRATGGAGLGLAVVRSLAEAHGGTVEISQTEGGGGRVIVKLPVFQAS